MNSCNTDIFFSNYYHLQSVRFESHMVHKSALYYCILSPQNQLVYYSATSELEYTRSAVDDWDTNEHVPLLSGFQFVAPI